MSQEVLLDVRQMIPRERHPKIFKAWEELPVGGSIKLINDHNPKPLFYEFKAERTGEFEWRPIEEGPERWIIAIKRVAPAPSLAGNRSRQDAPSWMNRWPTIELDVRDELRRGGEPLGGILDAAEKIGPGQILLVRAIFEPRPLFVVLGNQGFESWAVEDGPGNWRAYFCKKPWCHKAISSTLHGAGGRTKPGAGNNHVLDVRGLEAPEPMVRILSTLPEMGPSDMLEVTHFREPFPLYAHLEEAGFEHSIEKLAENLYKLKIRRKG